MDANANDNAAQAVRSTTVFFPGNAIAARARTSKNFIMARFSQLAYNFLTVIFRTIIAFVLVRFASYPFSRNRYRDKFAARAIQLQKLFLYGGPVPGPA